MSGRDWVRKQGGEGAPPGRGGGSTTCLMMLGLWALQLAHCSVGMRARKSEMSSDMASDRALVSSLLGLDSAPLQLRSKDFQMELSAENPSCDQLFVSSNQ